VSVSVKALIGQHGSASADAEQAIALVEKEPSVAPQRASAELMAVFAALSVADGGTARRHLRSAAAALNPENSVDVTAYERQQGLLAMLEGDFPTALRLSRAAVISARASGFHLREHIALIANALAAAHLDAHEEARSLLDEVFAHPFHAVCRWHHWVAGAVAAYAALRRGALQEALDHLRIALAVARECGFRHSPILLCCSDLLPRITALALRHAIEPEVARDIIVRNDLKAPPEAAVEWPWTIRLRLLGALEIERRGAPLPAARKESRRLLDLLRVLAAFGASPVSQERVADALWPDSDGDAARNALDTAVHRLRRLLDGDDIIVSRGGALQLNPQRCWSDVCEVEALLARLESAPPVERAEAAAALRRLYRGPLLPDEPLPLIAERRASLHRRVQAALQGSRSALVTATVGESVADP
jgi:tetratricopeptide (TPR) repeat protein